MDKVFIKEKLNNYRTNKTLLWQSLIVTIGGTIGLFFKTLGTKNNLFEIIFTFLGAFFIAVLIYFINLMNKEIFDLTFKLKTKE